VYSWEDYGGFAGGSRCSHNQDKVAVGQYEIILSGVLQKNEKNRVIPGLGVYLDMAWRDGISGIWSNTCAVDPKFSLYPAILVVWPDGGIVSDVRLRYLVDMVLKALKDDKIVEIGCHGAHGRTGVLAACILGQLEDLNGPKAIATLRKRYCDNAIENYAQEDFVCKILGGTMPVTPTTLVKKVVNEVKTYILPPQTPLLDKGGIIELGVEKGNGQEDSCSS
jgi:hypothetical protein